MEYEMPNPKLLRLVSLRNPSDFRSSHVSLYPDNHLISFKEKLRLLPSSFPFHELFILHFLPCLNAFWKSSECMCLCGMAQGVSEMFILFMAQGLCLSSLFISCL
jgi:hypothetical protein